MAIRKIIIKVSRSKHRIPPELREAAFKRKAGPIEKSVKCALRADLLKELDSAI